MKKLLICILCFAATRSFAQFRLGVEGSFSSLNMWQSEGYGGLQSGYNTWSYNGYQAGLVAEYDLGYSGLVLQPAVLYAENGSHFGNDRGFVNSDPNFIIGFSNTTLRVYSVRVPINLLYRYTINNKFKVFGGLGPYIAKNISGSEKGYYQGDSTDISGNYYFQRYSLNNKLKFNSNFSDAVHGVSNVKPFDFGMDVLLGVQYKKVQFSMAYNRGFSTLYRTSYVKAGNSSWNFTLAYMIFGHDRKPKL